MINTEDTIATALPSVGLVTTDVVILRHTETLRNILLDAAHIIVVISTTAQFLIQSVLCTHIV